jgi:threonine/homoserine/homoserine lactone efflux protein
MALVAFAVVTTITPGPNNLMLVASGVNFGFRRSIPHMMGINVGFPLMIGLVGLGLGQLFEAFPAIYTALKVAGVSYMLWLVWKIATAGPVEGGGSSGSPLNFLQAASFQWVNPKAWIMAVTAIATYTAAANYHLTLLIVVATFAVAGWPSSTIWVGFGTALRRFLSDARYFRAVNITMALLLVASLAPLLYH